jgi:hypothetical protein
MKFFHRTITYTAKQWLGTRIVTRKAQPPSSDHLQSHRAQKALGLPNLPIIDREETAAHSCIFS